MSHSPPTPDNPAPGSLFEAGLLGPLLVPVVGVALMFPQRTKPWGIGLLIGFTASLVAGAGACLAIFTS